VVAVWRPAKGSLGRLRETALESQRMRGFRKAGAAGIEPATLSLEGSSMEVETITRQHANGLQEPNRAVV
jgi:hypothetical protein